MRLHGRGRAKHGLAAVALALAAGSAGAATVLTGNDGVIRASLCVGADCPDDPSFTNGDILRLQETVLRVHFADTSTGGYPGIDWRLLINDSLGGGQNYWAVEEVDTGRRVFTLQAGAPQHALVVGASGAVGLGTDMPVTDLHLAGGDTPALRLEQDGSSGWLPQAWDLAGNETHLLVRDVTAGTLPVKIKRGAPTDALVVAADGRVGLGTFEPAADLEIRNTGSYAFFRLTAEAATIPAADVTYTNGGGGELRYNIVDGDGPEMRLDAAGNMWIAGALTQNSDRAAKTAIDPVDPAAILARVAALDVSEWSYKADAGEGIRHIGPMAQDFHALFGTGRDATGLSSLDAAGVALAAIRALAAENAALKARLDRLEARAD